MTYLFKAPEMIKFFRSLLRSENGAAQIEYALLAFAIGAALIAILELMGLSLVDIFNTITGAYDDALDS